MRRIFIKTKGIRQLLILIISSTILLLIFIFLFIIHLNQKKEVSKTIKNNFSKSIKITNNLSNLKKRELKVLANSISNGPILKGSLNTLHKETIVDTLNHLVIKNNLSFILILKK